MTDIRYDTGKRHISLQAVGRNERLAIAFDRVSRVFTSKDRNSVVALDDISLSVRTEEFVSVVGPSGCGKSTLLRLASGLLKPSSGQIDVFEQPMTAPRSNIGLVFQRPTLLPWLNVLDNIMFPAKHTVGRIDGATRARADELLTMIGLGEFARHRPNELSGGMQQRVAIARSLLQDPDILLMDEPFSALDALTRDELSIELLGIVARRPKTVVFVTHSIPEALLLSDRIVVMSARPGRLLDVLNVPLPRPRSLDTMVIPAFSELANDIRHRLLSYKRSDLQ